MAENNGILSNLKLGTMEVIQLSILLLSLGVMYGTFNNRLDNASNKLNTLEAKIEVLEGDRELLVRLDERLKSFDEKLDAISIAVGKQQSSN